MNKILVISLVALAACGSQALKDQAGYSKGGYASELAILRRSVQNR